MTCFRDFDFSLRELFGGNLLMLITIGFYITWWVLSFGPNGSEQSAGAAISISITLLGGLAAVALLGHAIYSLSGVGKGFPLILALSGAVVVYIILLLVTQLGFQRQVTAELPLITLWGALEGTLIAVLYTSGRYNTTQVVAAAVLLVLVTAVGLVCYVLHYHLEETARFWNGLIPLALDGGVLVILLAQLALS